MASRGSVVLAKRVEKHGEQTKVAQSLGVHSAMVSRWARGERRPDPKYRKLLEEQYSIPWQDWDEPAATQSPSPEAPTGTEA